MANPPPAAPRRKLVTLEDSVLLSMASNPAFTTEFPFLSGLAQQQQQAQKQQRPGCGSCQKRRTGLAAVLASAKQAVVNLSPEKRKRLKDLLNAEQIRVFVPLGNKVRPQVF